MQTRSLYIASLQKNSGSFSIALGLMELLVQNYQNVAVFEPVYDPDSDDASQLIEIFSLPQDPEQAHCFDREQFLQALSQDDKNAYALVIEKYEALRKDYDFVLILGINQDMISSVLDYDINFSLANHLSAPFAAVMPAKDKSSEAIISETRFEKNKIDASGCELFAMFVNMVDVKRISTLPQDNNTYYLPYVPRLSMLSVSEIKSFLRANLLYGRTRSLKRLVSSARVVSSGSGRFLQELENEDFIITAADRGDIILSILSLLHAQGMAHPSGLLLCGRLEIDAYDRLLKAHVDLDIAILHTSCSTFEAADKLASLSPSINAKTKNKLALAQGVFFEHVNSLALQKRLLEATSDVITPLMFTHRIFSRAKAHRTNIVLPESKDERILRAAELIVHKKLCDITLIGNQTRVDKDAKRLGLDLSKTQIIDPANYDKLDLLAAQVYEKRKHKGLSYQQAKELVGSDVATFATAMVQTGQCDGMVSGASHSTAETIRPALQLIKTKPGIDIVSSIFFIALDTKVLVYGDCAINKDPDASQLAQIALSSAQSAKAFGIEPKVAMLSYSSGDSGSGAVVEKVKKATAIVRQLAPWLPVEGPIQYDAAVDENVAHKKLPQSKIAGHANVFIFPDLNSGNNTYKAVQRSSKALAMGPVLQGLNKPVNDLSRGCSVEDIISTVAITAIQAAKEDKS